MAVEELFHQFEELKLLAVLRGDCNVENQHEACAPDDLHRSPRNTTIDHEAYINKNPACTADQSTPSVVESALSVPLAAACPIPTKIDNYNVSPDDIPQPSSPVDESLQRPTLVKPIDEFYCVPNDDTPDNQANMELQPIQSSDREKRSTQSNDPQHDTNTATNTLGVHNNADGKSKKYNKCVDVRRPASPNYTIATGKTCTTGFHFYHKPFEDCLPIGKQETLSSRPSSEGLGPTSTVYAKCKKQGKHTDSIRRDQNHHCSTMATPLPSTSFVNGAISNVNWGRGSVHDMVPKAICIITVSKPSLVLDKMLFGFGQQPYRQQQTKGQPKPQDYVYVASCRACFENAGTACTHCCGRKYGSQVKMKGTLDFGLGPWIRTNGSAAKRPCGRPPPGTVFTVKCS